MKYRFLKLLRSDVAWRRFSSSAAAREIPVATRRTRKRIPKAERKVMVEDFVNKYRAINAGKFPGLTNTVNQVGGSKYIIRAILQELEHNSKLSSVVTADKTSELRQSAIPVDKVAEPKEYGNGSENVVQCLGKIDHNSSEKSVVMPTLTRIQDTSVPDDFVNQTTVESQGEKSSDGAVDSRFLQSRLVEKTSADKTIMNSPMKSLECDLPGHSSKVAESSSKAFCETDNASAEASEFTKYMVTDHAYVKKQNDGSVLPVVEVINKTSMVRQSVEADQIPEVSEIINSQVLLGGTTSTDNGRVLAGSTSEGQEDNSHRQMKSDMPSMTKIKEIAEVVSGGDTSINLASETKSYADVDSRVRGVLDKSNFVEKDSTDEIVKASETESSLFSANSCHTSEVVNGAIDARLSEANEASSSASTTDGHSRERPTEKIQEVQGTLWGNLKSMAGSFINFLRKT